MAWRKACKHIVPILYIYIYIHMQYENKSYTPRSPRVVDVSLMQIGSGTVS